MDGTDEDSELDEEEDEEVEEEHDSWTEKEQALRGRLDAAVWCESEKAVEQQRLDRRWQREAGVEVWKY